MITGDKISAKEAEDMNMIYKAIDDDEFDVFISNFASKLAIMPTKGIVLTKKAVNSSFNNNLENQDIYNSKFSEILNFAYSSVGNCRRPTLIQNGTQNCRATLNNCATLISSAPCRDVCDA